MGTKGLIETLQFFYLESKIVSTTMTSITFTEDMNKYNSEKKGMEPQASLGNIWFVNDNAEGGLNQTFGQTDTFSWTNTKTLTTTNTNSIGVTWGIKGTLDVGLPGLVEAKTETSFEARYDNQHTKSDTTDMTDSHSMAYTTGSTGKVLFAHVRHDSY